MVSKDQGIGALILIVCVLVGIFYAIALIFPGWLSFIWGNDTASIRLWVVAIPVFVAFIAIMAIGAWIGWTMATTPPPKPIEEITTEMEEKKDEMKPEAPEDIKTAEPAAEEKAPEKKKKN